MVPDHNRFSQINISSVRCKHPRAQTEKKKDVLARIFLKVEPKAMTWAKLAYLEGDLRKETWEKGERRSLWR